jgi:ABC-type multidrug transport system ATPase subunit
MSDAPLLAARELRVDIDGAVAVEGASLETRGNSVAIVGDGYGLLRAVAGEALVRSGSLAVEGLDVSRGEQLRPTAIGFAPLDPPLPPRWTAREYLVWGARLAGMGHASAKDSAGSTLAELGLGKLASTATASLGAADRRALVLAQAIVARPSVLIAAAPLSGLSGQDAAYVSAVLGVATKGRRWIVSLSNLYAGSEENVLAAQADELLVFASGRLVRQGKLQKIEDGTVGYTLMLRARAAEFRDALRTRGVELTGGPHRFFVELPPGMSAQDLVALSAEVGAPLVELVPRILLS